MSLLSGGEASSRRRPDRVAEDALHRVPESSFVQPRRTALS